MVVEAPNGQISSSSDKGDSDLEVGILVSHTTFENEHTDGVIQAAAMQRASRISAVDHVMKAAKEVLF